MGLKSESGRCHYGYMLFAPYMGLKSDETTDAAIDEEFAPYMGLKRRIQLHLFRS